MRVCMHPVLRTRVWISMYLSAFESISDSMFYYKPTLKAFADTLRGADTVFTPNECLHAPMCSQISIYFYTCDLRVIVHAP